MKDIHRVSRVRRLSQYETHADFRASLLPHPQSLFWPIICGPVEHPIANISSFFFEGDSTLYALVSAWGFVWPRAWIGKVRGRRWVPATKRRGKGRYYIARILRVPLEGLTSGIAHKIWGENEVVTELRARTHYSRTR